MCGCSNSRSELTTLALAPVPACTSSERIPAHFTIGSGVPDTAALDATLDQPNAPAPNTARAGASRGRVAARSASSPAGGGRFWS